MATGETDRYARLDQIGEEFAQRYRRGERPSLAEYIDRYPELADDIRDLFPALVQIEQAEQGRREPSPFTAPARQIGDYRLVREIGRGGMGVVYEADQLSLQRRVALKVLPRTASNDGRALERFRREARAAARLHHTNIVPVYEVGQDGDTCFYAMQFIAGQGLDRVIQEVRRLREGEPGGPAESPQLTEAARSLLTGEFAPPGAAESRPTRSESRSTVVFPGRTELSSVESNGGHYFRSVARIGHQVADALAYAHARGIVHRDVKPSNLLLDEAGVVWVTDFGLAKTEDEGLTHTGDLLGTLRYMAPERFDGICDARADVYGLGLTLYEMLVLRPAFAAVDRAQLMSAVRHHDVPRPRDLNPHVPRDLETIVLKAIAPGPAQRYASAALLADDLERFLDGRPIRARRVGELERLWSWCRRNPAPALLLSLVVAVAVSATTLAFYLHATLGESEQNRVRAEEAEEQSKEKLWEAYLAQARVGRMSRQPGQRFASLRAIQEARKLPLPKGRSLDELRDEATAALCLPDLERAVTWDVGAEPPSDLGPVLRYDADLILARIAPEAVSFNGGGLSPDRRFLAAHPTDTKHASFPPVWVWRLDGGEPRIVLKLDRAHRHRLTYSPDSRFLVVATSEQHVDIYDLESGGQKQRLATAGICLGPAFHPRRSWLAVPGGTEVRLYDWPTGTLVRTLRHPEAIEAVAWRPDGQRLAVGAGSRIHLWDAETGREVMAPWRGHRTGGIRLAFSHTGDLVVSEDWGATLRLWDALTGRELLSDRGNHCALHFSADDRFLGSCSGDGQRWVLRVAGGEELRLLRRSDPLGPEVFKSSVLHPNGRLLAYSTLSGLGFIDLATHEELAFAAVSAEHNLRFDRTGSLWTYGGGRVLRWPVREPESAGAAFRVGPPEWVANYSFVQSMAPSPDGRFVALPLYNRGTVVVHRGPPRRVVALQPQVDVRHCEVSPDSRWVVARSHWRDASGIALKIWDADTGAKVAELSETQADQVVGFTPDGRWMVTAGPQTRSWEVGTWKEGPPPRAAGAVSPDGTLVAAPRMDGTVRLTAWESGREVALLTLPQGRAVGTSFSHDGGRLFVSAEETEALYLFDLRLIRSQLAALGLDWEAPPLPPAPPAPRGPLRLALDIGSEPPTSPARRLVAEAYHLTQVREYQEARTALRRALQVDPRNAAAHNNLAWLLLMGPKELRDPELALTHARKAAELAGDQATYHNTLGVALYRAGQFAEAVPVLERSREASKGEDAAFDLFVLAACHHRLGDAARAKEQYAEALRWFDRNRPKLASDHLEELTELQTEAAAVLAESRGR